MAANAHDPKAYEKRIVALLDDEDVSNQKGIYEYLLDGNEKHLSIRHSVPKWHELLMSVRKVSVRSMVSVLKIEESKPTI